MNRPLIAYFSPLKPDRSGVADYSERLLPKLAAYFDVHLYGHKKPPETPLIRQMFKWFTRRDYELQARKTPYDINVYQLGNSHLHQYMYPVMARYPGAVVLHDANLHHARANSHLGHRNLNDYLDELSWCHGEAGEKAGPALAHGYHSPMLFDLFPMLGLACRGARSVIVHNRFAADRVAENLDAKRVIQIPLPFFDRPLIEPEDARNRLGISPGETVVATFGFVTPGKGLENLLTAFRVFHRQYKDSRCVLVGGTLDDTYKQRIETQIQQTPGAEMTGYTTNDVYEDWLAAADICIALRFPTQGESSDALLRVMGAEKPVIVPDYRQFREIPATACVHIPVYPNEPYALLTALRMLKSNPEKAATLASNARMYALRTNSSNKWISSFADALHQTLALPEPVPLSQTCPLRHVRVAPPSESVAISLQNWGSPVLSDFVLNPVSHAMKELGIDA